MCTVSWIHQPDGYELFCNRDELRTRKPALPPRVIDLRGVRTIAPRDGDFGGSWISLNEFGLALSLLNFHRRTDFSLSHPKRQTEVCPTAFTSRGLLLMELADCRAREELIVRIAGKQLEKFQPFTLLSLMPDEAALIIQWNGDECLIDRGGDAQMPLTSSSFDSGKVIESRKRRFSELTAAAGISAGENSDYLLNFHRNHDPTSSAYSTCMHRPDAETLSFSRIKVNSYSVEFRYHPHSPCRESGAQTQILPRAKP
jgi:hypothetical protein